MTLDDLIAAYNAAYHSCHEGQHRAGIIAVVTALRDELLRGKSKAATSTMLTVHVRGLFEEILAPREGGNGAAGVTALEAVGAGLSPASGQAPAAPAPVCVWVDQVKGMAWAGCSGSLYPIKSAVNGCPDCRLPITFSHTEAQR